MDKLLPALGSLTLGGSAAIALLALLSRASRSRYGARWRCWAWLLLCLRLALPLPLLPLGQQVPRAPLQLPAPSDTVIYRQPPAPLPQGPAASGPERPARPAAPPQGQNPGVGADSPGSVQEEGFTLSLSRLTGWVWLAGALVTLGWALWAHLRFLLYLRRWSLPAQDPQTVHIFNELGNRLGLDRRPRLLVCQGLQVPMLAGLLRPVLLLPPGGLSEPALRYSLLHELTHLRRRDIWLKALALWVNALYWFNPLCWYMVRLVERDTELACDEAALRALPPEEHAAYGRTILDAAQRLKAGRAA